MKPKQVLSVEITMDSQLYAPGSKVDFTVKIYNSTGILNSDLQNYISLFVTDDSVFYKL